MNDLLDKIFYIPGWLDRAEYNGMQKGLDIWGSQRKESPSFLSEIVLAHSLGCHLAIKNWKEDCNSRLVLVNPLFPDRKWINWVFRWQAYFISEGIRKFNLRRVPMLVYIIGAVLDSFYFLSDESVEDKLKKIPKDKLLVIAGKKDRFFCNNRSVEFFKKNNIKIKVIDDMGHDFNFEKIKKELNDFLAL